MNYFYFIGENNKYLKSVLSFGCVFNNFSTVQIFYSIFLKPLDFFRKAWYSFLALCHTGVDGCWCTPWSSKPVIGVNSFLGGFDSHARPPCEIPAERSAGIFLFYSLCIILTNSKFFVSLLLSYLYTYLRVCSSLYITYMTVPPFLKSQS